MVTDHSPHEQTESAQALDDQSELVHAETTELSWADVGARSRILLRTSVGLGCDVALLSLRTISRMTGR